MADINNVGTSLKDQTGTGKFVGDTSPTLITPTLGAATATSITFNPKTNGIVGTTTNDDAAAGYVGEFISSTVLIGSAVALTSDVSSDITSISLTAGDWDVRGNIIMGPAGAGVTVSQIIGWISDTSATLPTAPNNGAEYFLTVNEPANALSGFAVGTQRVSLAGTTTIYLSCQSTFAVSTLGAYGFIGARRMR